MASTSRLGRYTLPTRALTALEREGITTERQLDSTKVAFLETVHGFGRASIAEVKRVHKILKGEHQKQIPSKTPAADDDSWMNEGLKAKAKVILQSEPPPQKFFHSPKQGAPPPNTNPDLLYWVVLKPNVAEFVDNAAQFGTYNMTTPPPTTHEHLIDFFIRQAMLIDPYKGGKVDGGSTMPAAEFQQHGF